MNGEQVSPVGNAAAATVDPRAGAWDRFYAHCFQIINQSPFVRRLSEADREDCVQDVMMEVVRKFGQRRPEDMPDHMSGWIRVVSRNKAVNITRKRIRKPEVAFDDGTGAGVVEPARAETATLDPSDSISLLWEALVTLDEEVTMTSYVIFYLRTIEGWSIPDIAEVFKITPEQVRFRCHRVRKRFGSILKSKGTKLDDQAADEGSEEAQVTTMPARESRREPEGSTKRKRGALADRGGRKK
jgi:RNA polymerase sigma factor (sigma-70 family)